jgi:hypothetical protein
MAYEVNAYGAQPKVRNPLGVIGLTLITLGIYQLVWYYKVNKELKDFGRVYKDQELADSNPTNSILAIVPGFLLIIPPFVSYYRFIGRVRKVERIGQSELTSGWLVLVLFLVISIVVPAYVQSGLNDLWRRYPRLGEGQVPPAIEPTPTTPAPSEQDLTAAPAPSAGEAAPPAPSAPEAAPPPNPGDATE